MNFKNLTIKEQISTLKKLTDLLEISISESEEDDQFIKDISESISKFYVDISQTSLYHSLIELKKSEEEEGAEIEERV